MTITKKDLALKVSEVTRFKKNMSARMVDALFTAMRDTLIAGNRIEIRGFGVLGVKKAKAKPKARNPKTNEVIFVPPHKKAFFKPGKLLMKSLQKPLMEL